MIHRRKCRQIKLGGVAIGGGAPISIQSMVKHDTKDVAQCVRQIRRLERAGCEIIRAAVKDLRSCAALKEIKKKISIPLEADIHFNFSLALAAIESGVDGIRLNPGNIYRRDEVKAVVEAAKKHKLPIRIGVNSGSLKAGYRGQGTGYRVNHRGNTGEIACVMVKSAMDYIKLLESLGFRDIMLSLKASDVRTTVDAYRMIAKLCDYPLHLGITATGLSKEGAVKSSIGIGALLLDGIGDTIRVSLAGDGLTEVEVAKDILKSLGLRTFGPEVIACPTCGRCDIDVVNTARRLKMEIRKLSPPKADQPLAETRPLKVAVMGCEVNGPGEAKDADIGIAGGRGCGILFKHGRVVRKLKEKDFISAVLNELRRNPKP